MKLNFNLSELNSKIRSLESNGMLVDIYYNQKIAWLEYYGQRKETIVKQM